MATKTVYAKSVGGFISATSGAYNASDEGFYSAYISSSAGGLENEAHIWFDTSNANTGLTGTETIISRKVVLDIYYYNNPFSSGVWTLYWGNGAGSTFSAADWRVDASNSTVLDVTGTDTAFEVTLAGSHLADTDFHVRIQATVVDGPAEIQFTYQAGAKPYLVIEYTDETPQRCLTGVGT